MTFMGFQEPLNNLLAVIFTTGVSLGIVMSEIPRRK